MFLTLENLVAEARQSAWPYTFYQDSQVMLQYLPRLGCVRSEWSGHFEVGAIRPPLELMREFAVQLGGVRKWLIDNRQAETWPAEDQEWYINDWFPQALRQLGHGHKLAYLLHPEHLQQWTLERVNAETLAEKGSEQDKMAYFANENEAMDWLELI
jgi:hypothetical protein